MLTSFLGEVCGGQHQWLFAYIGPGADLGLISSAIGLILTVGTSMGFLLLWPFRSLIRKIRGADKPLPEDSATP